MHTQKETSKEIKTKKNTYSLVLDVDIAESVFFQGRVENSF